MYANSVWGFIGLGAGLLFLIAPALWPVGEWKGLYLWAAMACFSAALVTFIWPRIFGRRGEANDTEAFRRHTDHQTYIADPAIQAFTQQRRQDIESGLPTQEMPLGVATHWIATRSSWARWQAAQMHLSMGNQQILRVTESYVLTLVQEGRLPTRGARNGDPNAVEFISPTWWGNFQFALIGDPVQIYRAAIAPRNGVDARAFPTYINVMCDWRKVLAIFPEKDENLDATTEAILRAET